MRCTILAFLLLVGMISAATAQDAHYLHKFEIPVAQASHSVSCYGCSVFVNGTVLGDVTTVAGNVVVTGKVTGKVSATGGDIDVVTDGHIYGGAYTLVGNINLRGGTVEREASAHFGTVEGESGGGPGVVPRTLTIFSWLPGRPLFLFICLVLLSVLVPTIVVRKVPAISFLLYKMFLFLVLSLIVGSAVSSSSAKLNLPAAFLRFDTAVFSAAVFFMVLLAGWELSRRRPPKPLLADTSRPSAVRSLRTVTVLCIVFEAAVATNWLDLIETVGTNEQTAYLMLLLPYLLVGFGLLRDPPYQWILAMAVGGSLPVGWLLLVVGLSALGRPVLLVLVILFFISHMLLGVIAFKTLRGAYVSSLFSGGLRLLLAFVAGAVVFLLLFIPALIIQTKD
jgi:hypothetical protein